MTLNLPNILTVIRIFIAPIFYYMLLSEDSLLMALSSVIFLIGALTDWFDGWYARKYNLESKWGAFVDPLADKLLTSSALYAFHLLGYVELWMVIIILIRDFGTTFLRIYTDRRGISLITSKSAKIKTFYQFAFLAYILTLVFLQHLPIISMPKEIFDIIIFSEFTYYSFLFLTLFAVYTLVEYMITIKNTIKKPEVKL